MGNSNQLCAESTTSAQHCQLKCCFTGSISQEFAIQTEESFQYLLLSSLWQDLSPNMNFQAFLSFDVYFCWFLPLTGAATRCISCWLQESHASMAGCWAWAAAILWWAAFPPVPPRWCCNRGSFPPSQWPGSTHRFIVRSCRNKEAIGSWNVKDKCKWYFKHLRRLNCWGSSLLLSTRSAYLLKSVYVYVF